MPAKNTQIENIGYASSDYVLGQNESVKETNYYKIYGILLDIKTLLHCHAQHDEKLIRDLAEKIENGELVTS